METVSKKLYEGLFLVDSAEAASDWDGINEAIKKIFDRSGAEVLSITKWDERSLAYDIQKKSRGTYILSYFKVDGSKIGGIERDVQLSEKIMRVMILNAEDFSQEDLERETPASKAQRLVESEQTRKAEAEAKKAEAIEQKVEAVVAEDAAEDVDVDSEEEKD